VQPTLPGGEKDRLEAVVKADGAVGRKSDL